MTWKAALAIFFIGLLAGGFLTLGFSVWCNGHALRDILRELQTLAARRKPGRKPRQAPAPPPETPEHPHQGLLDTGHA